MAHGEQTVDAEPIHAAMRRRVAGEPLQYIRGKTEFYGREFRVDDRVLIPRPETEILVETAIERIERGARVVDIGTGSGAVALALKDERPNLQVTGIDVSNGALAVARGNGRRLGLSVRFAKGDLLDGGTYDAMVANLPYVADGVAGEMAPEIRLYEPSEALFAGSDGLDVIRRLAAQLGGAARESLKLAAFEVAPAQAAAVSDLLLRRAGFGSIEVVRDLAGHERVVVGRR